MGSLARPEGPRSQRIYWVRRVGVLLVIVVLVLAGVLLVYHPKSTGSGGSGQPAAQAPATSASGYSPSRTASSASSTPEVLACDPDRLSLAISGDQGVVAGKGTALNFTVGQTTGLPCILDPATMPITVTVTSGSDRIWSTDDCPAGLPAGPQTVPDNHLVGWSVDWPGKRSSEKCTLSGQVLGSGTYVATISVGKARVAHWVMTLRQA